MSDVADRTLFERLCASRTLYVILGLAVLASVMSATWASKWISDDGYIYLSYVANYAQRGELAFNPGETVDAATGFLWLLMLVAADLVSPFETLEQTTLALSFALTLAAVVLMLVYRPGPISLLAAGLLFAPYFMRSFATSGLETPLIVFALVAVHYAPSLVLRAVLLGAMPFIRPELAVVTVIYAPVLFRGGWRWIALTAAVGLGLAALRFMIFGGVFPNTAFAKLGLPTYSNGLDYATEFLLSYPHLAVMLAALGLSLLRLWQEHGSLAVLSAGILPPVLGAILLTLYTVTSGGDFMHGRFFVPSYALGVIALAEIAHRTFDPSKGLRSASGLVFGAMLLAIPLGLVGSSFAARGSQNWWRGVMDEAAGYAERNPALHQWGRVNQHPWAEDGRRLAALSQTLGAPVGIARLGIGQIRMFSVPGDVYIYDLLSLTQVSGTLFDQMGRGDRPGHGSAVPGEMVYAAKRVTLFDPPDAELRRLLTFPFEGAELTLGALADIELYQAAGLLDANTDDAVAARVRDILAQPRIDTKALLYLYERYPENGPARARINQLYTEAAQRPHSYPAWFEEIRPLVAKADRITQGKSRSLPARYHMLSDAGAARPIKRRYAFRRYLDVSQNDCAVPPSDWQVSNTAGQPLSDAGQFVVSAQNTVLSLSTEVIKDRCGPDARRVQLLVQPTFGEGAAPFGFTIGADDTIRRFYPATRQGGTEAVVLPVADIDEGIRLTPVLAPGQTIGFEISTYVEK